MARRSRLARVRRQRRFAQRCTDRALYLGLIEVAYLGGTGCELFVPTLDYQGRGLDTVPDLTIQPKGEKLVYFRSCRRT